MQGRPFAPQGKAWEDKNIYWKTLFSDEDATFDKTYEYQAKDIAPMITYGTNPGMGIRIDDTVPHPDQKNGERKNLEKALNYMGLDPGTALLGKKVNYVFIGSCTNARIEDFRAVSELVKGRKKAANVNALIIPGSKQVEKQIKEEKIDLILEEAGFKVRQPGCSACLGMNEDKIPKGEYCVSTSNRNFEGRQGPGARTLLASPLTAAATALNGCITDVREMI